MSKTRASLYPDHQDHTEQVLHAQPLPFDVISLRTQSVVLHLRSAAIANTEQAITKDCAFSPVNARIYRALLKRLDWSTGATRATTSAMFAT